MEYLFFFDYTYFILFKALILKYVISSVLEKNISLFFFHIFVVSASMDISCLHILSDLDDFTSNMGVHICL